MCQNKKFVKYDFSLLRRSLTATVSEHKRCLQVIRSSAIWIERHVSFNSLYPVGVLPWAHFPSTWPNIMCLSRLCLDERIIWPKRLRMWLKTLSILLLSSKVFNLSRWSVKVASMSWDRTRSALYRPYSAPLAMNWRFHWSLVTS